MPRTHARLWTRRQELRAALAAPLGLALAACLGDDEDGAAPAAATLVDASDAPTATPPPSEPATTPAASSPTPSSGAATGTGGPEATSSIVAPNCDGVLTPPQPEGPFYTPGTPERDDLFGDGSGFDRLRVSGGETLVLSGSVYTADCEPVAGAWLDFWHTDVDGEYDNAGFELRGHQFSDGDGRYRLRTVSPAEYPGRPRHIHVKVQAPGGEVLTTQIYFPGDQLDFAEGPAATALRMALSRGADGTLEGSFDFVIGAP